MTTEEKAKAYDNVREKIAIRFGSNVAKEIFSEYEESEDERIRKAIYTYLKNELTNTVQLTPRTNEFESWLSWLEKRGEQKPNKAESTVHSYITPNLEFFQWIYDRLVYVHNENPDVDYMRSLKERIEDMQNPTWSEEDEKIRKGLVAHLKDLREWKVGKSVPIKTSGHYDAWLAWIEKHGEQKQEWSEEDLISLGYLATFVDENGDCFYGQNKPNVVKWIRSFANLNPTQKQEWSEEDSKRLQRIVDFLWKNRKGDTDTIYQQEQDIEWLKSLRPQPHWKPSDEQMEILQYLCETSSHPNEKVIPTLESLYQDLKKLREE